MTASPVVDLDVWRDRARVVRSAEVPVASTDVARDDSATVLRMPAPVTSAAPAGPVSPFGPVMAFGLVRRSAPAAGGEVVAPRAVHAPQLADREEPSGPPVLRVLPQLSSQPSTTSAPAPRLRSVADTRGASRGPRR